MIRKINKFFDKLEDKIRASLSRYPILYAIIGGVGIVLFWRGIWHTADLYPFMTGPVSIVISMIILLATGLFVSFFIGDRIYLSGLKQEKKLFEKTEKEIEEIEAIEKEHSGLDKSMNEIKTKLEKIEAEIKELKERK
ncbi:MAG: hypothetical protein PHN74_01900 [Candidatus Pacebacteria bacterium]|nr:hypothetical protein [Candidatus Paceibacterota bacterium]